MTRVLVVDDAELERTVLVDALGKAGFEAVGVGSGGEALRQLAGGLSVDVALVDLMMPGMSGLDLARQLKVLYPQVRVALASAYHLSSRQLDRAACGVVGFVPKPYRMTELCAFLRAKASSPPSSRGSAPPASSPPAAGGRGGSRVESATKRSRTAKWKRTTSRDGRPPVF